MKKLMIVLAMVFMSCTENQKARELGGDYNYIIEKGQKIIQSSWKNDDLWILTRPMIKTDIAETLTYYEKSEYGILEGTIKIIETK